MGLKPTKDESRHWDAVKGIVLSQMQERAREQDETDGGAPGPVSMGTYHPAKDTHVVQHLARRDFKATAAADSADTATKSVLHRHVSVPRRQVSVSAYRPATSGRKQAVQTELKPDLWKVAFNSIRSRAAMVCVCVW